MQLLWFIPSLAYGAMLAVSTQNYFLLVSTLLTLCIAVIVRYRISKRPKLSDKTQVRVIDDRIWLDDFRMPRSQIMWTSDQADFIFDRLGKTEESSTGFEDYLARSQSLDSSILQVALGFDSEKAVVKSLTNDGPHSLLIGRTGSGKTELLRAIMRALIRSRNDTEFVCIDFKGAQGLTEFESASIEFCSDQNLAHAEHVVQQLKSELSSRELMQKNFGHLIIAIDELSHFLASVDSAAEVLSSIAARGRSAKMHLVMTNQNLAGVSRALLSNIGLRILIGQPDPVDAAMLGTAAKDFDRVPTAERLAKAQIVGHGVLPEPFAFALPGFVASQLAREPKTAQQPEAREPRQRQRSAARLRGYSNPKRGRRRLRRQSAIRDLLLLARKAGSR